jgi:hypothetical protein
LALATYFGLVSFTPVLLARVPIGGDLGVSPATLVGWPFGLLLAALVLAATIGLRLGGDGLRDLARPTFRAVAVMLAIVGTGLGVLPLVSWAMNPPHELDVASARIAQLGDDAVLVGDWAPQLGFPTEVRTIYSNWNAGMLHEVNMMNLREIGATHVTLTHGVNEGYVARLDSLFPGARAVEPVVRIAYGGREVSIYEFRPAGEATGTPSGNPGR